MWHFHHRQPYQQIQKLSNLKTRNHSIRVETLIIPSSWANDQGEVSFMNRDLVLTINHQDLSWEAMPDLQVVILAAVEDDVTLPRSRSQINAVPRRIAGCSHVYPNARQIFGMNVGALLSP
jgi:hypothetical protein